jgi:phosphohistidine phosphatase SixA
MRAPLARVLFPMGWLCAVIPYAHGTTGNAAAPLSGAALVAELRHGGYVIVMRHPSSPLAPPDAQSADPQNPQRERQLDATGRDTARAMGNALRALHIPIGEVLSSPAYRARQAAELAGFTTATQALQLEEGSQGMQASADASRAAWLRGAVSHAPQAGTNTLLITHMPNLTAAFGDRAAHVAAGEALIFRPSGAGNAELVARVPIEQWPQFAASAR